jgi:hypothetical protein
MREVFRRLLCLLFWTVCGTLSFGAERTIDPAPYPVIAARLRPPRADAPLPVRAMYLHSVWRNEGTITLWGEQQWREYIDYLAAQKATMVSVYLWPVDKYGKQHLRFSRDPGTDNPATRARSAMYQKLADYAHSKGMEFWLGWSVNAVSPGFAAKHKDWQAAGGADLGGEGCLLCPSIPDARKALLDLTREQVELYPKCDGFFMGGIDLGGCQDPKCKPWWKTTCRLFAEHYQVIKRAAPKAKVAFCIWGYGKDEARQMIPLMPKGSVLQVNSQNAGLMSEAVKAGLETWMFLELDMENQMDLLCPLHQRIRAAVDQVRKAGARGVIGFSITPHFRVENEVTMLSCALNSRLDADQTLVSALGACYSPDLGAKLLPVYQQLSRIWLASGLAFIPMGNDAADPRAAFFGLRDLRKQWASLEPQVGKFPLLSKTLDYLGRANPYREVKPQELKESEVFLGDKASEAKVIVNGFGGPEVNPVADNTGTAYAHRVVADSNVVFLRRPQKPSYVNAVIWDAYNLPSAISVAVNGKVVGRYQRGMRPGEGWVPFSFPVPADSLSANGVQDVTIKKSGYPFGVAYLGLADRPLGGLPNPPDPPLPPELPHRQVKPEELKSSEVFLGDKASESRIVVAGFASTEGNPYADKAGVAYAHRVVGDSNVVFLLRSPKPSFVNVVIWDAFKLSSAITVTINGKIVGEYHRGNRPGEGWVLFSFPVPAGALSANGVQDVSIRKIGFPFGVAYVGLSDQPLSTLPRPPHE